MNYETLLTLIGTTPIIRVDLGTPPIILAKLEYLNPGGSIKDRSALYMIERAEKSGLLKPGGTVIEASSGNQGIASAMIGSVKGYKVIITVSEKVSMEKKETLQAYGAKIIICPTTSCLEDPASYYSVAVRLHQETPNSFMPNQYFNTQNADGHYYSLGPDIWKQTNGTVTHFFAAAGTGGTVSGAGKYLKEKKPNIKVFALDSDKSWHATNGNPSPYKVEGMGIDFQSPVLNKSAIDEILTVSDDNAIAMLKYLARSKGLLVGPTSGAAAYAVREYTKNLSSDDVVVVVFGDSGRAYLSKKFY